MNLTFYATDVKVCQDEGVRRSIDLFQRKSEEK